jgi:hypothetical protein
LGVGRKADDLLCERITLAKSKDVKTGCTLADSSKEGYGSKRAVLPVMMMMIGRKHPISPSTYFIPEIIQHLCIKFGIGSLEASEFNVDIYRTSRTQLCMSLKSNMLMFWFLCMQKYPRHI